MPSLPWNDLAGRFDKHDEAPARRHLKLGDRAAPEGLTGAVKFVLNPIFAVVNLVFTVAFYVLAGLAFVTAPFVTFVILFPVMAVVGLMTHAAGLVVAAIGFLEAIVMGRDLPSARA